MPDQTGPEALYLAALRDGRLTFQRRADGGAVFPPRLVAPGDGAPLQWAQSAGFGVIHSITEQPQRPPEPTRLLVLVDLDEGFRMLSHLATGPAPAIGTRVRAVIDRDGDIPSVGFEVIP
jgi:uncharacterized OB-fold protein